MKIVRERIYEIKRDKNVRGLSSIGVGAVSMCKAYMVSSKMDDNVKHAPSLDRKEWVLNDGLSDLKNNISSILDAPVENIVMMYKNDVNEDTLHYFQGLLDEDVNDISEDIFELEWSSSRKTKMAIRANKIMGIAHISYLTNENMRISFYALRKP